MKQIVIFILVVCCCIKINAQRRTSSDTIRRTYIPIKTYKKKYKEELTKKDSINFMYHDSDTLVLVENYVRPKGVSIPYEYKDSTFLHYYKKIAFRQKGIDSLDRKQRMRYWKDPIKIFFSESVSKKTKKDFMSFAEKIANQVDSLKISEAKKVEDSNYVIYYFGDYEYEPRMVNYTRTDYYINWNGKQQIYRCSLKLDTDLFYNEILIQKELREKFIGTLGHFYFINNLSCESYFANCYSNNKQLTALDIEMIKYHYSYGICKGTDIVTFESQHKQAKKILDDNNGKMMFFHEEG